MKIRVIIFLFPILFLQTVTASDWEDMIIGPEFTFTNYRLLESIQGAFKLGSTLERAALKAKIKATESALNASLREDKDKLLLELAELEDSLELLESNQIESYRRKVKAKFETYCQGGRCQFIPAGMFSTSNVGVVRLESGVEIEIKLDPNVFEVTMTPMSLRDYKKIESEIQQAIFDNFSDLGLTPNSLYGSGHINIDLNSVFGDDVKALRNFVVDYFNHPGVSYGVMEHDAGNARPMFLESEETQQAYRALIEKVDRNEIVSVDDFINEMNRSVYQTKSKNEKSISFHKDHIEIRAVRAQETAAHFELQSEMFGKKIDQMKKLAQEGKIIKVNPAVGVNGMLESLAQYYHYVSDLDIDWERFEKILPRRYRLLPIIKDESWAFRSTNSCNLLILSTTQKMEMFLAGVGRGPK